MKNNKIVTCAAVSVLAFSFVLAGCDREVSSEKSSTVSSDGTVTKSEQKTVTNASDGTVTKTEETKKTVPPDKP